MPRLRTRRAAQGTLMTRPHRRYRHSGRRAGGREPAPAQQAADEMALTNNSSLIKHVRDNKLVSPTPFWITWQAGNGRCEYGEHSRRPRLTSASDHRCDDDTELAAAPCAYIRCGYRDGRRQSCWTADGVWYRVLHRIAGRPSLPERAALPHGFDPSSSTTFVNAYTDITRERESM